MPVLHARGGLDYIALVNDSKWFAAFLVIASALGDEEHLAGRVDVPVELRAGSINGLRHTGIERGIPNIQLVEPDGARMVLRCRQFSLRKGRSSLLGQRHTR